MTGLSPSRPDVDRIVPLNPEGTATPLFCVHASSGSAYSYLPLSHLLGADQPVHGIEAPGFEGDRAPVASVPELSAQYTATLREVVPEGALHLLGWSLGGLIVFDMARRLSRAGVEVGRVILVDTSPPHPSTPPPEQEIVRRFLHDLTASLDVECGADIDALVADFDGDADAVFERVERAKALPPELEADLLSERYAVFHAHHQAVHAYRAPGPYAGPVWHLLASESPPQDGRWAQLAPDLTEHTVPGNHHSIWRGDGLQRLAGLTRSALAGAPHGPESNPNK